MRTALLTLAFQIFTVTQSDSPELRRSFPPLQESLAKAVEDIGAKIGVTAVANRQLGFIAGPLSFDQTPDQLRQLIAQSFAIALRTNMAVGFHVDDSMFWSRLASLNQPRNLEWLDFAGTPNTGRRLDWSKTPLRIQPQLCLNSPEVTRAVQTQAALIGEEVRKGIATLHSESKDPLFIGVIAGWETQIGKDFETGKSLGDCALANKGFSAAHPPADFDQARRAIVQDFIAAWAQSLRNAGVPADKIYSHIATPTEEAFTPLTIPGFSVYPNAARLAQLRATLAAHGNPIWASCEGTPMRPELAAQNVPGNEAAGGMEAYLGNLFNHGAQFVNVFGWGVGNAGNPFRQAAESEAAIAAYRKFLRGELLKE